MKRNLFSMMVMVGVAVMLLNLGNKAYAWRGDGNHGMGMCLAANTNLTDDQIKRMETERNAFKTATQGVRQQINEKRTALNAELAKQAPDASKCTALQKEVSDLQAQLEQKRVAHILEMKIIDPNFTEGPGMGPGMGHGMGPGMGPGKGQGMGPGPMGGPASN
jgi:Spy/CpxP family protein refolding chaperone